MHKNVGHIQPTNAHDKQANVALDSLCIIYRLKHTIHTMLKAA